MKKTIFFLLFFFLSGALMSQNSKFLSLGIEINPKIVTQQFENAELGESGYSLNASIEGNLYLNFRERIKLKTGINFNQIGINNKDYSTVFGSDHDGNGGVLTNKSWTISNYKIYYVGIPLAIRANLTEKENNFYCRIGGDFLLNLAKAGSTKVHECGAHNGIEITGDFFEPTSILILADFGIGYEFFLKENQHFYIEHNLEFSLNDLFDQTSLVINTNSKLLNVGIVVGMRF